MPIINGVIYPELYIYPHNNDEFKVLLFGIEEDYLYELMQMISVAKTYAAEIGRAIDIKFYVSKTASIEINKNKYGYITFDAYGMTRKSLLEYIATENIDLIYKEDEEFITKLYTKRLPVQLAENIDQLENEIEAYLTGKNIPWLLGTPIWNTTWFIKNVEELDIMQKILQLQNLSQTKLNYNPAQKNYVRALSNKATQIRYCEEKLLGLIQMKNYSERNHTIKNVHNYNEFYDYSFELNYHLGNYYFLISGAMDIIGRLLMSVYKIPSGDNIKPNIEHSNFQCALSEYNEILAYFYADEELNSWMVWLKRKRNYVAHESESSYSDVIHEKKVKLTDQEVENKLNQLRDWNAMKLMFGEDAIIKQMEDARFVIRLKEDNKVWTRDAMIIKYYNFEDREPSEALFHPLIDIKADYNKVRSILNFTASQLMGEHE